MWSKKVCWGIALAVLLLCQSSWGQWSSESPPPMDLVDEADGSKEVKIYSETPHNIVTTMETDGETLEMEKQPEEEQSEEQPQGDQPNEPLLPEEPDQEGDNEGSEEVILPDQQDTSSNTHAPIPAPAPTPPATRPPLALQFCYSCSSANNASCATHPYNQKKCNPYNGRHTCYTLYKLDTKVTTRGCWIELTEQDQSYCKIKRKECEQCHEPACNTRETIMAGGAQLGLFSICFYCILSLGIWLKPM